VTTDLSQKGVAFNPKDRVTFDQLPEQIRKHYQGLPTSDLSGPIGLQETQAYLMLPLKPGEEGFGRVNVWEKTTVMGMSVGQEVGVECGHYKSRGKVVEVTPLNVTVQLESTGLLRFDNSGKGYYTSETYDCPGPWVLAHGDWVLILDALTC
jgi:hypothetical protein